MPIEIDAIIAQIEWVAARGLTDFAATVSGAKLRIQRSGMGADAVAGPIQNAVSSDAAAEAPKAQTIDAPMAGICYLASENGKPAFVSVGDRVALGQTICIIEAMKVMTSITATRAGTIAAILIEDGSAVNAGTALFEVAP